MRTDARPAVALWRDADGVDRWVTAQGTLLRDDTDGTRILIDVKQPGESLWEFVERADKFYESVEGMRRII